ncbi:MAG: hypothetical protein IPO21_10900 [Bacteroidales bacterium]|nr:hypothetical protein [Bacteroidales bacterium]
MNKIYTLLFVVILSLNSLSQSTILTTEGEFIPAYNIKISDSLPELYFQNRFFNTEILDIEDVFSIKDSVGEVTFVYKQNPKIGYDLELHDMINYVDGIVDSKKHYKATTAGIIGAGLGFLSHFMIISNVQKDADGHYKAKINNFYAPIIPVVYCATVSFIIPNKRVAKSTNNNNPDYIDGYKTE